MDKFRTHSGQQKRCPENTQKLQSKFMILLELLRMSKFRTLSGQLKSCPEIFAIFKNFSKCPDGVLNMSCGCPESVLNWYVIEIKGFMKNFRTLDVFLNTKIVCGGVLYDV